MIKIEHAMNIHRDIEDSIKRHSIIEGYRKYILANDLDKYLGSVMNVRNDEKAMRLMIIELQKKIKE